MYLNIKHALVISSVALFSACGGGDSTTVAISPYLNELQGVWIYSSDNHLAGGACGLDSSGNYGARLTFSFAGNRYTTKQEACLILNGGNTGGYLETNSGSGTVSIGNIYLSVPTDTTQNLRSIDFISSVTYYTSYRINNGRLFIGDALGTYDGSTAAKRASYVTGLAAFIKQ